MNIYTILLISILGPIIGSFIGVVRRPTENLIYNMLAFAAGVMISVSVFQLIPESVYYHSILYCLIGMTIGAVIMWGFDKIIPHIHPSLACAEGTKDKLSKTTIFLLFGIFMHNLPEGMAIGISAVSDFKLSFIIVLAITIHDIPEAICTSAPCYFTSAHRLRSFLISLSTAIPTVIGILLTYYIFRGIPGSVISIMIGATAGLMIYISISELIPSSFGMTKKKKTVTTSFLFGIVSVLLLGLI